ncbi:uncharacterized protein LOC142237626 [Haematobia irritans]|uniref:uncharacterized protein LOC142237626 n=1 Tax=Haematobia irritans TaxID=7368 RepID=UPI003F4FCB72
MEKSSNPFFLYINDCRQEEENRNLDAITLAKIAGENWRKMTLKEQKIYQDMAMQNKMEKNEMVDASGRRRRRRSQQSASKSAEMGKPRRRRRSSRKSASSRSRSRSRRS